MARDDFPKHVIDRLAKRVGMKCSYPDCRAPTSGPDSDEGITNVGVAAHISAASPGGARYNSDMEPDARSSIQNGIWLCQNHAKLIDDDELKFPVSVLEEWKLLAEHMAALEARGYVVSKAQPFSILEKKVPKLIAEMRLDLQDSPLTRQFILLSKAVNYNPGSTPFFAYYYEDHESLDAMITILQHYNAAYDVAFNRVPRFNFSESFVDFLIES